MKKRWFVRISVIAIILITVIALYNVKYLGEKHIIAHVKKMLYVRYDRDFEYIKSLGRNGKKYVYLFTTKDERKINFEVEYWIGALSTPWGGQPLIQTRHVVDNFPKAISAYTVAKSIYSRYDITDIPVKEASENISLLIKNAQGYLNEYGASYQRPDLDIMIVFKGREYPMTFSSDDTGIIKERITRKVY